MVLCLYGKFNPVYKFPPYALRVEDKTIRVSPAVKQKKLTGEAQLNHQAELQLGLGS